jgi:hypothetical protein
MKRIIVITDLTRMYRGMVCIAGYDENKNCIRPILPPPGIPESSLYRDEQPIIFPFAVVEFDLIKSVSQPPHTEDWRFDPNSPRFIRTVKSRQKVLEWSLYDNVSLVFEQPILNGPGFYVLGCQGVRSLGTIQPVKVIKVIYASGEEGTWDYRLNFIDGEEKFYKLKITDLTWHYYCDSLRETGLEPVQIAEKMTAFLQSHQVYIRIGLARGWKKYPERCYLQINGIFTFPDYLSGKTFADFKS